MKPGDRVLLPIGSWYKGRFVDNDREVEGVIVQVRENHRTAFVSTEHGQNPNGCPTRLIVWRMLDDLKPVEGGGRNRLGAGA